MNICKIIKESIRNYGFTLNPTNCKKAKIILACFITTVFSATALHYGVKYYKSRKINKGEGKKVNEAADPILQERPTGTNTGTKPPEKAQHEVIVSKQTSSLEEQKQKEPIAVSMVKVLKEAPRPELVVSSQEPLLSKEFFFLGTSDQSPDPWLLHFFLADFVGGGDGYGLEWSVPCFKQYLDRYCTFAKKDISAQKIQNCLSKFYSPPLEMSLQSIAQEILSRLSKDKYIAIPGGYYDQDAGHAMFYEFIMDNKGAVTFKSTNSGDGLRYHPKATSQENNKNCFNRTLVRTGATIEQIRDSQFIEMLFSFKRPRQAAKELKETLSFPEQDVFYPEHLYQLLFYGWPGKQEKQWENPGGPQRANSCSVLSLMKWVKQMYEGHLYEHLLMNFWFKISLLSDYLHHSPNIAASFVNDVVRKISALASKMVSLHIFDKQLERAWFEVSRKAKEAIQSAGKAEQEELKASALLFLNDLTKVSPVGKGKYWVPLSSAPSQSDKKKYTHQFPGERLDLSKGALVSKGYWASLYEEMSHRLNFFRLLPDCTDFDTWIDPSWDQQQFLKEIGLACQKFYYTFEGDSLHYIPSSFFADLFNGWMILYLKAKKEKIIPEKVLLEWIDGATLLAQTYEPEYTFDTVESKSRFTLVSQLCIKEREQLRNSTKKDKEKDFWRVWNVEYKEGWGPFGAKFLLDEVSINYKDLPQMAHFAYQQMKQCPEDISDLSQEEKSAFGWYKRIDLNEKYCYTDKAIAMFSRSLPRVPHYDAILRGLGCLFLFADRHLYKSQIHFDNPRQTSCFIYPEAADLGTFSNRKIKPFLDGSLWLHTHHPAVASDPVFYPETHLPKIFKQYSHLQDLNQRIQKVHSSQERHFPFFTEAEEKQYIAFVQKDPYTSFTEFLTFCKKILPKLSSPDYQSVLEYVLFGMKGRDRLDLFFTQQKNPFYNNSLSLLFDFFEKGYRELLGKTEKKQLGVAFLLHLHFRLIQLCFIHNEPRADERKEILFVHWITLLDASKQNPFLAKALGQSVISALSVIEICPQLREDPRCLPLLAKTILLECTQQKVVLSKYHPLTLLYGYHAFIEFMSRSSTASLIWQQAAEEVFGKEQASNCSWDREKGTLHLSSHKVNLKDRFLEGDDLSLRLLPEKIVDDWDFKKLFGKRNFIAQFRSDLLLDTYTFRWRNEEYQIVYSSEKQECTYFKKIEDTYYLFSTNPLDLPSEHCFVKENIFWKKEKVFVENKKSHEIIAVMDQGLMYRMKKGKRKEQVLSVFSDPQDPLQILLQRVESPNDTVIWMDGSSKQVAHIVLPRLNIKLSAKKVDETVQLQCPLFPGFFLAHNQYVDFLKNFQSYLVLENENGQRKVVVPPRQVLLPHYDPYKNPFLLMDSGKYEKIDSAIIFDLEPKQQLPILTPSPSHVQATVLLLYLYLTTKQYRRALDLIEKTSITSKRSIDPVSRSIVEKMIDSSHCNSLPGKKRDLHPYAVAIRMHLYHWGLLFDRKEKNPLSYCWKLGEDIDLYEDLHQHLGRFALSETVVFEIKKRRDPPRMIEKILPSSVDLNKRSFFVTNSKLYSLKEKILSHKDKLLLPPTSYTLLGEEFILNFLPYYAIALGPETEQKQSLKRLIFTSYRYLDKTPEIFILHSLLLSGLFSKKLSFDEVLSLFESNIDGKQFNEKLITWLKETHEAKCLQNKDVAGLFVTNRTYNYYLKDSKTGKKITFHPTPISKIDHFDPLSHIGIPIQNHEAEKKVLGTIEGDLFDENTIDCSQDLQACSEMVEWAEEKESESEENPVVKAQFTRIKEGVILYQKDLKEIDQKKSKLLTKDQAKVELAQKNYETEIKKQKKEIKRLKNTIVEKANDLHGVTAIMLELLREERIPLDMSTLLISLGRGDRSIIRNGNPTLSDKEIEELMQMVAEFALKKSVLQKLTRCLKCLNEYLDLLKLNSENEALKLASDEYWTEREAIRVYTSSDHPFLLVFETLCNCLVRKEQYDVLNSLTDKSSGWKLFERKTNFGKSTLILPLWLLLTAKEGQVSIMSAPVNLFDRQETYLQKVLQRVAHIYGVRIDFNRDSDSSAEEIQAILEQLKMAERKRLPVFMSDQTAHNLLVLKLKEKALAVEEKENPSLQALLDFRQFMKQKGVLYLDEPHQILDDSQETNYSLGMPKQFDEARLLLSLYLYEQFFLLIQDKFSVEFWQDSKKLPLLSDTLYEEAIVPDLLEAMIKKEQLQLDEEGIRYLQGKMSREEQQLYEENLKASKNQQQALKVRILHDQLYHFLPLSLGRNANEHYALHDEYEDRIAIPLQDARNPKKGNEFISPDQIINFTIQANLKSTFSLELLTSFLEKLSDQATSEMEGRALSILETIAYKKFSLLIHRMKNPPRNLVKITQEEIQRILNHIHQDLFAKLQCIGLIALPKLRHFEEKISSNPHLLVSFSCFQRVVGATGTLAIQNLPCDFTVDEDKKAIAKTLITLLKKLGKSKIVEFEGTTGQELMQSLPTICPDASVLIEIGSSLRDFPSQIAIAQGILQNFSTFDGVAAFDEKGSVIVLKRKEKKFIAEEVAGSMKNLFWDYEQKDITGTDQKLPPQAKAVGFANEFTTVTKLVQGVGRLRGLFQGQSVQFVLDRQGASLIRKGLKKAPPSLTFLDLLAYCAIEEGGKNGIANFHSLPLQWDALIENRFWDNVFAQKNPYKFLASVKQQLPLLFVEETKDRPLERASLHKEPMKIGLALPLQLQKFTDKNTKIEKALSETIPTEAKEIFDQKKIKEKVDIIQAKMAYPEKIHFHGDNLGMQTTESTAEQISQGEQTHDVFLNLHGEKISDQESETHTDATKLWSTWCGKQFSKEPLPRIDTIQPCSIEKLFAQEKIKEFFALFKGTNLMVSANGVLTLEGDTLSRPGWVNGYMKPLHYILQDEQDRYILIDESEASMVIQNLKGKMVWLVNHGVVFSKENKTSADIRADFFKTLELEAKILNGDLHFDEEQWQTFLKWNNQEKCELFRQFIPEILFPLHPLLETSPEYFQLLSFYKPRNGSWRRQIDAIF